MQRRTNSVRCLQRAAILDCCHPGPGDVGARRVELRVHFTSAAAVAQACWPPLCPVRAWGACCGARASARVGDLTREHRGHETHGHRRFGAAQQLLFAHVRRPGLLARALTSPSPVQRCVRAAVCSAVRVRTPPQCAPPMQTVPGPRRPWPVRRRAQPAAAARCGACPVCQEWSRTLNTDFFFKKLFSKASAAEGLRGARRGPWR